MTKQELKKQFEKDIKRAVLALKKYNPDKIILYGSVARGDFDENSDIDLLVIKKGVDKIKPHKRIYKALQLLDDCTTCEPRVYSPREVKNMIKWNAWFLIEALEQGRVLYEKNQSFGRTMV